MLLRNEKEKGKRELCRKPDHGGSYTYYGTVHNNIILYTRHNNNIVVIIRSYGSPMGLPGQSASEHCSDRVLGV